jgi:hypothetical protein
LERRVDKHEEGVLANVAVTNTEEDRTGVDTPTAHHSLGSKIAVVEDSEDMDTLRPVGDMHMPRVGDTRMPQVESKFSSNLQHHNHQYAPRFRCQGGIKVTFLQGPPVTTAAMA